MKNSTKTLKLSNLKIAPSKKTLNLKPIVNKQRADKILGKKINKQKEILYKNSQSTGGMGKVIKTKSIKKSGRGSDGSSEGINKCMNKLSIKENHVMTKKLDKPPKIAKKLGQQKKQNSAINMIVKIQVLTNCKVIDNSTNQTNNISHSQISSIQNNNSAMIQSSKQDEMRQKEQKIPNSLKEAYSHILKGISLLQEAKLYNNCTQDDINNVVEICSYKFAKI